MNENQSLGFDYDLRSSGEVVISRHGKIVTTLRGDAAEDFMNAIEETDDTDDEQLLMARVTGNYKRGNERQAREHPRNRE